MRIAHSSLVSQISEAMSRNQQLLAEKQIQIGTGRNYVRRSQDTDAAAAVTRLEEDKQQNERWELNIDQGTYWSRVTDGKLNNLNEIMQHVREVTTASVNGTHPESYRQDLAVDVNNALEDIFDLSNSQVDGVPIFAGTATGQLPFTATRDPNGEITGVTYSGSSGERQVQVSNNSTASYGVVGGGASGVFMADQGNADPADDVDVFQSLINLRDTLAAGTVPGDTVVSDIENSADNVISNVVDNGLKQTRFEALGERMTDLEMESRTRISQLKDIDIAKAATELSQLQASYQASLQIAARIDNLNLMKFI